MDSAEGQVLHPFLMKFAVPRTGDADIPGRYSSDHDMWVVESSEGIIPIISSSKLHAGGPVTKVQGERDQLIGSAFLEMATKTRHQVESEDTSPVCSSLLELMTKTEVQRERDDDGPKPNTPFLELATKTDTRRERDDW